MRILAKFPSRQRPAQLKATLCSWKANQEGDKVTYLISLDEDDPSLAASMNAVNEVMPGALVKIGRSGGKIHAINRDMDAAPPWDILVLISDDMRVQRCGWDKTLAYDMERHFPALDGALHYPDGIRNDLITLSVMGRKLYQAFGYIYHPDYLSLWCLDGDSLVYMANQTLKPIRDVVPGDFVVGTDAMDRTGKRRGPRSKLAKAVVKAVHSRLAETVRVTLASGATVICTPDHSWGYYNAEKSPHLYGHAKVGRDLVRVHAMPGSPPQGSEWLRGWLAGMYDGEGSFPRIVQSSKNQANCEALAKAFETMGIKVSVTPYTPTKTSLGRSLTNAYYISGGRDEYIKFLEWMRPVKCDTKQVVKRVFTARFGRPDKVVRIEPSGTRLVHCLTTSTGNFVAEGILSHNCDNEFTDSVRELGKYKYLDHPWYRHHHCSAAAGIPQDDLYRKNESHFSRDEAVYRDRKARGFDIELVRTRLNDGA